MKMRFVTEYANWKKNYIMQNSDRMYRDGYTEQEITDMIQRINKAVANLKRSLITVDEAMREIAFQ